MSPLACPSESAPPARLTEARALCAELIAEREAEAESLAEEILQTRETLAALTQRRASRLAQAALLRRLSKDLDAMAECRA